MTGEAALPANVQRKNLLHDFYGCLLTEKQNLFFTMHYMEDLSLAEIGEQYSVTPQAVADLLKRTGKLLDGYEARLGLVKKLSEQKEKLSLIQTQTDFIKQIAREKESPELSASAEQIFSLAKEMVL